MVVQSVLLILFDCFCPLQEEKSADQRNELLRLVMFIVLPSCLYYRSSQPPLFYRLCVCVRACVVYIVCGAVLVHIIWFSRFGFIPIIGFYLLGFSFGQCSRLLINIVFGSALCVYKLKIFNKQVL